jgi:hypothetical protein
MRLVVRLLVALLEQQTQVMAVLAVLVMVRLVTQAGLVLSFFQCQPQTILEQPQVLQQ